MLASAADGFIQSPRQDHHGAGPARTLPRAFPGLRSTTAPRALRCVFGALRLGMLRAVSSGMGLLWVLCAAIESAAALSVNACVIANASGHTRMDLVIDQHGFLSQPDLHDGHVLGLRLLDKEEPSAQRANGEGRVVHAVADWLAALALRRVRPGERHFLHRDHPQCSAETGKTPPANRRTARQGALPFPAPGMDRRIEPRYRWRAA